MHFKILAVVGFVFTYSLLSAPRVQEPLLENNSEVTISDELKKWHKVSLTFNGPLTAETDSVNPFLHYNLNVTFQHPNTGKSYKVPGYFAADGNAGETSAVSGNKWRVHFSPDEIGIWTYRVSFRKGIFAPLLKKKRSTASAGFMDQMSGKFKVLPSDKKGRDLRAKGRLQYVGKRYLQFSANGEYFLKVGPDAPENFLAFADFDGTFHNDGQKDDLVKNWSAHLKHWKEGDPSWKGGKGKAIIGAINYLAYKELNAFSFITMNIAGDDRNVFPYIDYNTYDRYDCSKLDQWEMVFEHADRLGMFLHFKLMEAENQGLLDNGAIGVNTQLYYRELIARFGHHLALNWNVAEEAGEWNNNHITMPLNKPQRFAAAQAIHEIDPYNHHIVIHNGASFDDIVGPDSKYSGISLQTNKPDFSNVHRAALKWINVSERSGKTWAVAVDEPGDHRHALLPDAQNPEHNNARINGLWGAMMAGAWGTEWYFGYKHPHSDLTCQDYASRDLFWDQCRYLLDFFTKNEISFWSSVNQDSLVNDGDFCLAEQGRFYIVYLRKGAGNIDLSEVDGKFSLKWFDPRNGGGLQNGKLEVVTGGKVIEIKDAPSTPEMDWVVLIRRIES